VAPELFRQSGTGQRALDLGQNRVAALRSKFGGRFCGAAGSESDCMMLQAVARSGLRAARALVMTRRLSPVSISISAIRGAGRDLLIVPDVGCSFPVSSPSRVDLPLPFGPMMPSRDASETAKVTPSKRSLTCSEYGKARFVQMICICSSVFVATVSKPCDVVDATV
jgi:hypothetical protein